MTLYDSAKKDFLKTIDAIAGRHTPKQVFTDFVSMAAMSISNAVDFKQEREKKSSQKQFTTTLYTKTSHL